MLRRCPNPVWMKVSLNLDILLELLCTTLSKVLSDALKVSESYTTGSINWVLTFIQTATAHIILRHIKCHSDAQKRSESYLDGNISKPWLFVPNCRAALHPNCLPDILQASKTCLDENVRWAWLFSQLPCSALPKEPFQCSKILRILFRWKWDMLSFT